MDIVREFSAYYDSSYREALPRELTENYDIMECLSCAQECDTLLVRHKASGARHVAKCYARSSPRYGAREPEQLRRMKNAAIPQYIGEYISEEYHCVLREYVEGISLNEYVKNNTLFEEALVELAIQLVHAMKVLHDAEPAIIHRDIKPENIIVKEDGGIALIDLGISRSFKRGGDSDTIFCGTEDFAPPEQYGFMQTDIRSDIYSFGVVLSWLLTGRAKPIQSHRTRLERIAARCCAFAPDKRYKNDQALLRELRRATVGYRQRARGRIRAALLLLLLLAAGMLAAGAKHRQLQREQAYVFREPLIEEAVRVALNKPEGVITGADLEAVTGIYIQAGQVYADEDTFYEESAEWYNGTQRIRGTITDLSDLEHMPRLREVYIGGNLIEDLSPLGKLKQLQEVELRSNNIRDISPLAGSRTLDNVRLSDNPLEGIEAVRSLPMLRELDLGDTGSYDASPIGELVNLNFLDINNDSDAYLYLDGLYVNTLRIRAVGQTDLECLRNVIHVRNLYLCDAQIWDISALEGREDIVYLNLEQSVRGDLTPLFNIPNLATVEMSVRGKEQMEELIARCGEPSFEIVYSY